MKKRKVFQTNFYTITDRLWAVLASLVFSIPTALLIWFWLNLELALVWDGFVSSPYLLASIIIFSVIAFFAPKLFPSILGWIWETMITLMKW